VSVVVKESHRVDHVPAHQDQDEIVAVEVVVVEIEIEDDHREGTDHHEDIETMMMGHENSGVDHAMIMTMRPSFARDHATIVRTTIVIDKGIGAQETDHDHSATIDVAMIDPAEMIGAAMTAGATIVVRVLIFSLRFFLRVMAFRPVFLSTFFVLYIFAIFFVVHYIILKNAHHT